MGVTARNTESSARTRARTLGRGLLAMVFAVWIARDGFYRMSARLRARALLFYPLGLIFV